MADPRIHPSTANPPPPPPPTSSSTADSGQKPKAPNPPPSNLVPPPATYVVQLPREQIFRYPPPENARNSKHSPAAKTAGAAAVDAAVSHSASSYSSSPPPLYPPACSTSSSISSRRKNPNGRIGIYYLKDSSVNVFYNDVELSGGVLPTFYQPKKNVTVLQTPLTGSDVVLTGAVKTELRNAQNRRRVPLVVNVEAPVKIRVGSAKTWKLQLRSDATSCWMV
ncbi:hypothetical protein DH2020_028022 [Rehmannia glutinosa]|uniref:Late embryogenesis abundant protein LEA-2 subgroup domain-containing protein n=1 Tax=Rehmannia glutinosa TaxID=99300 RepID=A0ABR0VSJ0_REHGL